MNYTPNYFIGIDAQPRGLAISQFEVTTQKLCASDWYPLSGMKELEEMVYEAFSLLRGLLSKYSPLAVAVEFPAAVQSGSTMELWCLCGAVIAAARTHCNMVEGIVPTSWKKFSGLNQWARDEGIAIRGQVSKKDIKQGVIELISGTPIDLEPLDIYDAIAIGKAGLQRNLERVTKALEDSDPSLLDSKLILL